MSNVDKCLVLERPGVGAVCLWCVVDTVWITTRDRVLGYFVLEATTPPLRALSFRGRCRVSVLGLSLSPSRVAVGVTTAAVRQACA